MSLLRTGFVAAPLTIVAFDLNEGATFNADVTVGLVLRAGVLMAYDPATKTLRRALASDGSDIFGVLSDDCDAGAETVPAMVYRRGTFLRQEIESANNIAIPPGSVWDLALNDLGIHLELSYEGYEGISPVPPGVEPMAGEDV